MLDIVSLIAGVIAITSMVIEGVKHARTVYQASEELRTLQASDAVESPCHSFYIAPLLLITNTLNGLGTNRALCQRVERDQRPTCGFFVQWSHPKSLRGEANT